MHLQWTSHQLVLIIPVTYSPNDVLRRQGFPIDAKLAVNNPKVFVALLLVRLVNRSTGPHWRPLDTLGVLGFCVWAAQNTQQPLILLVASVAFALDATLKQPLRWHYFAAAACAAAFIWMLLGDADLVTGELTAWDWWLVGASAGGIIFIAAKSPEPVSCCDTSPDRLDRVRVNAGLLVGWLAGFQALLTNGHSAWLETPIWVCLFAVLFTFAVRVAKRRALNRSANIED